MKRNGPVVAKIIDFEFWGRFFFWASRIYIGLHRDPLITRRFVDDFESILVKIRLWCAKSIIFAASGPFDFIFGLGAVQACYWKML